MLTDRDILDCASLLTKQVLVQFIRRGEHSETGMLVLKLAADAAERSCQYSAQAAASIAANPAAASAELTGQLVEAEARYKRLLELSMKEHERVTAEVDQLFGAVPPVKS